MIWSFKDIVVKFHDGYFIIRSLIRSYRSPEYLLWFLVCWHQACFKMFWSPINDEIWNLISNWFIYYDIYTYFWGTRHKALVSWLCHACFVTSCHACFVVLPRLNCFRRLELRLNCFRSLELRLTCFRRLKLRLNRFRRLQLRLNCFRSLELRSTCFRNLELRLFRDFVSRLFRGLPRLFSWLCVTLGYLPSWTVCPRLFS